MPCWTSPCLNCRRTNPAVFDGRWDAGRFGGRRHAGSICSTGVVPRHGRTGWLFTSFGRVVIKQARYARDEQLIDPACRCPVCTVIREPISTIVRDQRNVGGLASIRFIICGFRVAEVEEIQNAVRGGTFLKSFAANFTGRMSVDRPTGDSGRTPEYERVFNGEAARQVAWIQGGMGAGERRRAARGLRRWSHSSLIFRHILFHADSKGCSRSVGSRRTRCWPR